MKIYTGILIILIIPGILAILTGTALAESSEPFPDEEWNRIYSIGTVDNTHWIEQTSDGGYIIIGTLSNISRGVRHFRDYFVMKTSAKGEEQWSRKFTEEDEDRAGYAKQAYIMQTSDRGFLIAGSTENFATASLDIWIRKMDAEGIELWKKDFRGGRPSRQYFGANPITGRYYEAERSVRETTDGGFLVLGKTDTCLNCSIEKEHPMDIWLMKIDQGGNEEWNRTLGRTDQSAYSFTMTHDGGFILAGVSFPDTTWFKKSDQNGNELWNRTYEGIGGRSVVLRQATGGGYAAAITDTSGSQIKLIKIDTDGGEIWKKTYGESSFDDFQSTQDGGFILWQDVWAKSWLLKIDTGGNEQWKTNTALISISYLQQSKNGDYLAAGQRFGDIDSIMGSCIAKIDSRGNKLWEKVFKNDLSWWLSTRQKTIEESDDGYVVMGSASGSSDLKLKKFKKREIPFAMFTYEPEYPGVDQPVTFDASVSNDPRGNITNYRWDFGDGNTADTTGEKVNHSYGMTGEMRVKLTVTNNTGGVNSTWKKVFVQKLAAPEETFNVSFGSFSGAQYANETSDGGFIIAGGNRSIYEVWLVRTDPDGKELWNWTYRGIYLQSVIQTSDGGFMVAGGDQTDSSLIKIDTSGKEQWRRIFKKKVLGLFWAAEGSAANSAVVQTHDGGYAIAGFNLSYDGQQSDAWLAKTDSNGSESWSRIFGRRTGINSLFGVKETSDGGYIVTGTWSDPYSIDAGLIKINSKGNEEWDWHEIMYWASKTHGPVETGPVLQTPDGGFIMMGTSSHLNASAWYEEIQIDPEWSTDIWLMRADARGTEQWRKSNRVKSLAWEASFSMTEDGGYIYSVIVQERPENDYEHADSFSVKFVKLDQDGNIEWQKRDEGYSIKPTSDGGYVTARGSSLVRLGWIKPELSLTGITPDETSANLNGTPIPTISSPEKAAGFEAVLSITIILAMYIVRRKKR